MTPLDWYDKKRKEYKQRYGRDWSHRSMFAPNQDTYLCETVARSGIECRWLKPMNSSEIEMIGNAIMIQEYLQSRKNMGAA